MARTDATGRERSGLLRGPAAGRAALAGVAGLVAVLGLAGCVPEVGATTRDVGMSTTTASAAPATAPATRAPAVGEDVALAAASATSAAPSSAPAAAPSSTPAAVAGTALAALETVAVKGRAPKTGYSREQFGQAWADVDRNGCDTRNDVLRRDLTDTTVKAGTRGCVVLTGTLADPYAPRTIGFVRGPRSADVQIDHVVALSDAWQKGAQALSPQRREALANDPLNLLAVDGPLNASKGDGDAATWLPPNRSYRCAYVARQVAVKVTYGLWMTQAEHDAVAGILRTCPGEQLPTGTTRTTPEAAPVAAAPSPARTSAPAAAAAPRPAPAPAAAQPQPAAAPAAPAAPSYANCTAVKAAGAAPIRRGDPGWEDKFDRDGDGVGCEP